jgi:hypothetical protein
VKLNSVNSLDLLALNGGLGWLLENTLFTLSRGQYLQNHFACSMLCLPQTGDCEVWPLAGLGLGFGIEYWVNHSFESQNWKSLAIWILQLGSYCNHQYYIYKLFIYYLAQFLNMLKLLCQTLIEIQILPYSLMSF